MRVILICSWDGNHWMLEYQAKRNNKGVNKMIGLTVAIGRWVAWQATDAKQKRMVKRLNAPLNGHPSKEVIK